MAAHPPAPAETTMPPARALAVCTVLMLLTSAPAAPPAAGLRVPPGFEVVEFAGDDLARDIFTMTLDPRGRVVVAGRGYIRLLLDDNSDGRADRAVQVADTPTDGAMGLLWEGDTLYAVGDGGLRRLKVGADGVAVGPSELVRKLKTGGEHHAHALRRGPDGWLYLLCGNATGLSAADAQRSTSPVKEPIAGGVLRFPPDFSYSEVVCDGFRNAYDFDFNGDGELFTYDSDNERCVGLPWYEGTRLYHVIPGGHYGWQSPQRAETWRMPPYFPDVVAPIADLGRGSPTGVACYRHRQFPAKYRGGVFLGEWTFGKVWFVPLRPSGSTYAGKPEPFIEAAGDNGFAPTALCVHPRTGDLYVSIGGRGTRGAVYRVRHPAGFAEAAGYETPPLPHKQLPARIDHADPLALRTVEGKALAIKDDPLRWVRVIQRQIGDIGAPGAKGTVFEGYTPRAARTIPAELREQVGRMFPTRRADLDRELSRTLAMMAAGDSTLPAKVAAKLTADSHPVEDIHYLIALARLTAPRPEAVSKTVAAALLSLDHKLTERAINRDRNWPLRIAELHAELSRKDPALNARLLADADFARPGNVVFTRAPGFDRRAAAERFLALAKQTADFPWTAELVQLMGHLPAETLQPLLRDLWQRGGLEDALLPLLAKAPQPEDRGKFLDGLRSPQLAQLRLCLDALARLPPGTDPAELLPPLRALRALPEGKAEAPVRDRLAAHLRRATGHTAGPDSAVWTDWLAKAHPELAARLGGADGVDVDGWRKRLAGLDWNAGDAERGKTIFDKASCAACHSGGQALGPDLRGVAGRFSRDDLLTAIIQPSKDVSPRYRTTQLATADGKVYQGLVVYEAVDGLILQTGAATTVRVGGGQIESRGVTDTSLMPAGLLDKLVDREIADLLAYLRVLK